jgi:hypothetical protein
MHFLGYILMQYFSNYPYLISPYAFQGSVKVKDIWGSRVILVVPPFLSSTLEGVS